MSIFPEETPKTIVLVLGEIPRLHVSTLVKVQLL